MIKRADPAAIDLNEINNDALETQQIEVFSKNFI